MTVGIVLGAIALPMVCLAQGGGGSAIATKLTDITNNIVKPVAEALVVLMLIVAGVLFLTAAGNPGKLSTAKACFLWAVIGAIVIAVASVISAALKAI